MESTLTLLSFVMFFEWAIIGFCCSFIFQHIQKSSMGDVFSKSGLLTILFAGGVCLLLIFINGSLLAMIMSATFGLGVLLQIGIFAVVFRLQPTPKFEQKPLPI